jgi:hypothetical protein
MFTTLFDESGSSFLSSVNSQDDEGGHAIQEATVIHLKVSFFQVEFQLTENSTTHHHGGLLHHRLLDDNWARLLNDNWARLLIDNSWCFNNLNGRDNNFTFLTSYVETLD